MVRMSHPFLSGWVAKLLRRVWHEIHFSMPTEWNLQLSLRPSAARWVGVGTKTLTGVGTINDF